MKPTRSETLDLLRFPLALVVLFVHTFSEMLLPSSVPSSEGLTFFFRLVEGFLRGQSVPIYYFISGYVFFLGVDFSRKVYFKKLKNRVHSLLIPYLIWNGVSILLIFLKTQPFLRSFTSASVGDGITFSLHGLLSCFWVYQGELSPPTDGQSMFLDSTAPINIPLWFLRNLMVVVLTTPVLYWLLKRWGRYVVVLLGLLWFFSPSLGRLNELSMVTAYFFFSWGAYMSLCKKDIIEEFGRFFTLSLILFLLLGTLYVLVVPYGHLCSAYITHCRIVAGLLLAYNLSAWLLRKGYCKVRPFLASSSFYIYISNALVCGGMVKVLFHVFPSLARFPLVGLTLGFLGTLFVLLLSYRLLDKYFPRFLNVIAGRKRG